MNYQTMNYKSMNRQRRLGMPYGLAPNPQGGYSIFGREYHPLPGNVPALTEEDIAALSWTPERREDGKVFLYNDGRLPDRKRCHFEAYKAKLLRLEGLGWCP